MMDASEGRFVWADLTTPDEAGAAQFYGSLFGWEIGRTESEMGTYLTGEIDGHDIAGMMAQSPDQAAVPPMWTVYIASDRMEDTLQRIGAHGGSIVVPPFDIPDGQIAIAADPGGGTFAIAQWPGDGGFETYDTVGAVCWAELLTRDVDAAIAFYTGVFGWVAKAAPTLSGGTYTTFSHHGAEMVGVMAMPPTVPAEAPAFWQVYFKVDDINAAVAEVRRLGATVLVPPMQIGPNAWFATVEDPQGAGFSLFAGAM